MTSGRTTQVRISPKTAAAIRKIAASFGYYQSRGSGAHTVGNIADMLDAIVRGELVIIRNEVTSESLSKSH